MHQASLFIRVIYMNSSEGIVRDSLHQNTLYACLSEVIKTQILQAPFSQHLKIPVIIYLAMQAETSEVSEFPLGVSVSTKLYH